MLSPSSGLFLHTLVLTYEITAPKPKTTPTPTEKFSDKFA
jgi:hypothetical protein